MNDKYEDNEEDCHQGRIVEGKLSAAAAEYIIVRFFRLSDGDTISLRFQLIADAANGLDK